MNDVAAALKEIAERVEVYDPRPPAFTDEALALSFTERHAHESRCGSPHEVSVDDFVASMPMHNYIFKPTREPWPAASVDARLPLVPLFATDGTPLLDANGRHKTMKPSAYLDKNAPVEQMTWAPGKRMLICNRLVADGGWIERNGVTCFNLYRPAIIEPGDAAKAGPWVDLVHKLFTDEADHIIQWLAHRVQHPEEKINHALVLGGEQGIGKDTILDPVRYAVGPWNFAEVNPEQVMGRFNGVIKSIILRVSEAHDLGDVDRFKLYEHTKTLIAAPPDVLRCDEKNLREHAVLNRTGVVILTNHKTDGIFLPPDDRRHFVAWSDLDRQDFTEAFWTKIYAWYENGGRQHVAAYLASLDISSFNPKAPPPQTPAFWEIVDANRAPEDAELADVLDVMNNPDATTLRDIMREAAGTEIQVLDVMNNPDATTLRDIMREAAGTEIQAFLQDRKNRRVILYRLEKCGYVPVRNDDAKDGLWKIDGARQAIYAKVSLSVRGRFEAAKKLASGR